MELQLCAIESTCRCGHGRMAWRAMHARRPHPLHRRRRHRHRQARRACRSTRRALGGDSIESRIAGADARLPAPAGADAPARPPTRPAACCSRATPRARDEFQAAFEAATVEKIYLAVRRRRARGRRRRDRPAAGQDFDRRKPAGGWSAIPTKRRQAARPAGELRRARRQDPGRVPPADRPHAPDPRPCRARASASRSSATGLRRSAAATMLLHAWRLVVPRGAKPTIDVTAPLPDASAVPGFPRCLRTSRFPKTR